MLVAQSDGPKAGVFRRPAKVGIIGHAFGQALEIGVAEFLDALGRGVGFAGNRRSARIGVGIGRIGITNLIHVLAIFVKFFIRDVFDEHV
jgi:hypothetical protein